MDLTLNINKPPGITSFAAVAKVRRVLNIKKAGHAGTLDPMATGVLLILTEKATRISQYLMGQPKEYLARIKFGMETDTCDIEGQVIRNSAVPDLNREMVLNALSGFTGKIFQKPPAYSAIKINGQPAYKKARQGNPVDIPEREVQIDSIELTDLAGDEIAIKVHCSKGTYIRSLARDIGESLNTCATLSALCRTAVGLFNLESAVGIDDREELLHKAVTIDQALSFMGEIALTQSEYLRVRHGNSILTDIQCSPGDILKMKFDEQVIALGRCVSECEIHPECVILE